VVIGACLIGPVDVVNLLATVLAFFLAVGVAAHALDELNGRPLRTRISNRTLIALAVLSLAGALAIGLYAAAEWGWALLAFMAAGAFLVPAYNLELFGGRFHGDWWFALAWGGFAALTGFFVEAQSLRIEGVLAAAYATALSLAQRRLSTPVRHARRSLGDTAGTEPMERALQALTWTALLIACALVAARLT